MVREEAEIVTRGGIVVVVWRSLGGDVEQQLWLKEMLPEPGNRICSQSLTLYSKGRFVRPVKHPVYVFAYYILEFL